VSPSEIWGRRRQTGPSVGALDAVGRALAFFGRRHPSRNWISLGECQDLEFSHGEYLDNGQRPHPPWRWVPATGRALTRLGDDDPSRRPGREGLP
jgi:hypothetical protein